VAVKASTLVIFVKKSLVSNHETGDSNSKMKTELFTNFALKIRLVLILIAPVILS